MVAPLRVIIMTEDPKSFERQWRARFVTFAASNEDDAGIAGWSPTGLEARVRRFAQTWGGNRKDELWLDAGCGAGTYVRVMREREVRAIGLDYSSISVQKARDRTRGAYGWAVGDVTALPVKPASVDGILCFGVTQALSSSHSVVSELARVVRPDGEVWIDGLNSWCVPHLLESAARRIRGRPAHVRYESPYYLRRLLIAAGMQEVKFIGCQSCRAGSSGFNGSWRFPGSNGY